MTTEEAAVQAYTAYKAQIDGVFVPKGGLPLSPWEGLTAMHKAAWTAAAAAVLGADAPVFVKKSESMEKWK